jgi:hypothetical protein
MVKRSCAVAATLIVSAAAGILIAPASASAATPDGCVSDTFNEVTQEGSPTYSSTGSAAGKYNASTSTSTLSYSLTTTTSRSTSWSTGGSATISWGVGQVQANTSYTVTTSTSTGKTYTDTLSVPGHDYGYTQPKVEYRDFDISEYQTTGSCTTSKVKDYGILHAITASPFFSECVASSACTPKP